MNDVDDVNICDRSGRQMELDENGQTRSEHIFTDYISIITASGIRYILCREGALNSEALHDAT